MSRLGRLRGFDDFRARARQRLPHFLFEYIDGGSYDETTLRQNSAAFQAIELRQRVLRDVAGIDTSQSVAGQRFRLPVLLGPIGLAGLNARRGEVQAARAAEAAGAGFCLSTVSLCSIEEVAGAVGSPLWFQLYVVRDRAFVRDMLRRARLAGCAALVLTVDLPTPGARHRDIRSGLSGAPGPAGALRRGFQVALRPGWAWDVGLRGRPHAFGNIRSLVGPRADLGRYMAWIAANFDPTVTWADLDFIRAEWDGPLFLKGILDAEDARAARAAGVTGIIVSNHGGRQLDGAPATARALPAIAEAVGQDLTILVDGGIRSGIDVVRALALGADAVLLGRAWAFALAAAGQAGVAHLLEQIEAELRVAMALIGVTRASEIDREVLIPPAGGL